MSEWISVENNTPVRGVKYWAFNGGAVSISTYEPDTRFSTFAGWQQMNGVTHFMKLIAPEPPN